MSFQSKWLLATFLAQLVLGAIFTSIVFKHLTGVANVQAQLLESEFVAQVEKIPVKQGQYDPLKLASELSQLYNKAGLLGAQLTQGDRALLTLGAVMLDVQQVDVHQPDLGPLLRQIQLPLADYQVLVQFDAAELYRARNDTAALMGGTFILSAFACMLIMLAFGRQLSTRLDELRKKALALQAGNLSDRIKVSGDDELSVLGATFNRMADAVQEQVRQMEQAHARSVSERNRLDLLLSSLGSGVAYLDSQFNVQYVNKALAKMLRLDFPCRSTPKLEILLLNAGVVKEQRTMVRDLVTDYFGRHEVPVELDFTDGRVLQFRFAFHTDGVQGAHGVLIAEDVSIRKNVEDLRNEVERDPLTGVLNRRGFELSLESRLARLLPGESLGVLFIDLDGFKEVNDTLGHKAGDQILKNSGTLFKGATRNIDVVARLGGDEFAIIVARCNKQLICNIAERILDAFRSDKLLNRIHQNHGIQVTCSIGGALYPMHSQTMSGLIETSDSHMYMAKKAGKNCYRLPEKEVAL